MASACFSSTVAALPATGSSRGEALLCRRTHRSISFLESRLLSSRFTRASLCFNITPTTATTSSASLARAQFSTDEIDSLDAPNSSSQESDRQQSSYAVPPEGPKLYVGNLAWSCSSEDLAEHFQGAGTVEEVEVICDRESGRSRGFGFVTMGSMEEANVAVARYDGEEFLGRRLRVSFPDRSRNDGGPRFEGPPPSNANKLFVGNLPWGMDDITLENLFSEHGKVLEARVVYDRESGRSRGFGFVTLSSSDEVSDAISKMDGAEVQGRPLRVNLASDRPPARQNFF